MTLMMGFPIAAYLTGLKFRSRYAGLAPSLAAELEAFAAEQEAKTPEVAPRPAAEACRPASMPRPLRCREA